RGRLRGFVDLLVGSLGEPARGEELARRAHLSRYHFDRLVAAALHEPPAALRRRLLLERAAYRLRRADTPVTDVGYDAGYGSPEAFTRSFTRAFGMAPSAFRSGGPRSLRPPAPHRLH